MRFPLQSPTESLQKCLIQGATLPGYPGNSQGGPGWWGWVRDVFSVAWWHQSTRWVALSWMHLCQPWGLLIATGAWLFSFHWKFFRLTLWCFSNPSGTMSTCNFFSQRAESSHFFPSGFRGNGKVLNLCFIHCSHYLLLIYLHYLQNFKVFCMLGSIPGPIKC